MKNSQRGFVRVLLIIVALLIIGGVVYFYMSKKSNIIDSNNETSVTQNDLSVTWKTYSNPEHQFSIKYPSNWTVEAGTNGVLVRFRPISQIQKLDTDAPIDQVFVDQEEKCSSKDWNVGFADASYKHVCDNSIDLGISMVALSLDSKNIEDKIASSFVNMGYVKNK